MNPFDWSARQIIAVRAFLTLVLTAMIPPAFAATVYTEGPWRLESTEGNQTATSLDDCRAKWRALPPPKRQRTDSCRVQLQTKVSATPAPTPVPTPTPTPAPTPSPTVLYRTADFTSVFRWGTTNVVNKALVFPWTRGSENYNGADIGFPETKKVYVRVHLKFGAPADHSGIQKILRFRNAADNRRIGTLTIHWGAFSWHPDDLAPDFNFNQSGGPGPTAFDGAFHYLELMADHTGNVKSAAWVDGKQIYAFSGSYTAPPIGGVMLLGTFNGPADTRTDVIDEVVIATSPIGMP